MLFTSLNGRSYDQLLIVDFASEKKIFSNRHCLATVVWGEKEKNLSLKKNFISKLISGKLFFSLEAKLIV